MFHDTGIPSPVPDVDFTVRSAAKAVIEPSSASAPELVEQLKEIARLRAEGALTESEFEAVKARLLSDEASA